MADISKIGSRIRDVRLSRGLSQSALAEKANISSYTINKLNRGDNVNTDTLEKICCALNCSFDDIMEVVSESSEQE